MYTLFERFMFFCFFFVFDEIMSHQALVLLRSSSRYSKSMGKQIMIVIVFKYNFIWTMTPSWSDLPVRHQVSWLKWVARRRRVSSWDQLASGWFPLPLCDRRLHRRRHQCSASWSVAPETSCSLWFLCLWKWKINDRFYWDASCCGDMTNEKVENVYETLPTTDAYLLFSVV